MIKEPTRKFYSEKYMNLVSQPVINSNNGTERKISIFNDNVIEKKEETATLFEQTGKGSSRDVMKKSETEQKRKKLLSQH